ncbi:MAG: hypothetical protein DA408_08245 [Bacteroidetes bacterium]|nr:MAG: hypothetical protein C7N36_09105 [Bacteroidota bacterium]PTM13057.1 MAG: hypothetical protein DA408_08245 [Bacteroidota bacterium]
MSEFYAINRYVLLIRPSQSMINWINKIYPADPIAYEAGMLDDNTDVYLIPEMDDLEEARQWLENNFLVFFENSLEEWCENMDEWPEKLDWEAFEQFFDYSLQSNVLDIVSEEEDEEYADFDDDDDADDDDDDDADDDVAGSVADKDDADWN